MNVQLGCWKTNDCNHKVGGPGYRRHKLDQRRVINGLHSSNDWRYMYWTGKAGNQEKEALTQSMAFQGGGRKKIVDVLDRLGPCKGVVENVDRSGRREKTFKVS